MCLLPKLFSKTCFVFHVLVFDDVMIFEYLKSLNFVLSQEQKELSKWNKKHFSLFHKCSFLEIQNKLVKM